MLALYCLRGWMHLRKEYAVFRKASLFGLTVFLFLSNATKAVGADEVSGNPDKLARPPDATPAAPSPWRHANRTSDWETVEGDLLCNFLNMYNLTIVFRPQEEPYPVKGWFFGWATETCNPPYRGCDAIFAARAPRVEGPWQVYSGNQGGKATWDASMTPGLWAPVIEGGTQFFNNWHNGDPSVIYLNGRYYMAYSATGHNLDGIPYGQPGDKDSDLSCIMGAVSTDGLDWEPTAKPLLIEPSNIGGTPPPGNYNHVKGNYHRPSLMHENGVFKMWFDSLLSGL